MNSYPEADVVFGPPLNPVKQEKPSGNSFLLAGFFVLLFVGGALLILKYREREDKRAI